MTAQQLMMIYCGLLVAILILGFIGGMIHGRRKATYKLVTTIIFYGVFFLIVDKVALTMVDAPILDIVKNSGVALPDVISGASSIKEACVAYLTDLGLSSEEIIPVIMSFAMVVTKIVFTLIYFILIGIVYCILVNIIYYLFVRRKKSRLKKLQKKQEEKPEMIMSKKKKKLKLKQHRFTGGILGFVKKVPQVIVVIAVTTGIISLIPTIKGESDSKQNLTTNIESDELLDLIEQYNLQEYVKFVEMYQNSAFVKVLGGDTKENSKVSGFIFDKLTKGTYKDFTLDLKSEMAFVISTSAKAIGIMGTNTDVNSLTTEQQMEMCALLKDLTNSELIMNLLPIGASVALSLQEVKDAINTNLPGLELDPSLLKDVNWENDIIKLSDTAMALVDLSNGFQNLENLDFLHMDPEKVKVLTSTIANVNILMKVIPVLANYAVDLPEVKEQVGDLSEVMKKVIWEDELTNIGDIYEKFYGLGLETLDNILGDLTAPVVPGQPDKLDKSQELITTVFQSTFISSIFPVVINKAIEGQPNNVQDLFKGLEINQWDNELNTIIDLARDVRDNGGNLEKLDLTIVRDVDVDTILRSEVLTQGFTQIFTTIDDEDSLGAQMGLGEYLYVPLSLKEVTDKKDNGWYKKAELIVDEKGEPILDKDGKKQYKIEKRELYDILSAFQKILPKEGEIDFAQLPQYILQIDDKNLADDTPDARPSSSYSSIFDSEVLRTSISKLVSTNEQIKDMVVVPLTATEKIDEIDSIKINELNSMVKGLKALGITDFTNIEISNELIQNLENPYVNDNTKTNLDIILKSEIVNLTLANLLDTKAEETGGQFVIPLDAKEKEEVTDIHGVKHRAIQSIEIKKIIKAFNKIDIDISNPSFDISLITNLSEADLEIILDSKIVNFNLTNQVVKLGGPEGQLVIPQGDDVIKNGYINDNEVKSILKAFKYMEITDFDNIVINNTLLEKFVTIPEGETKTVLDIALDSKILQSTISGKVETISNENLVIPAEAKETKEFKDINGNTHKNIKVTEFNLMVNAVLDLGIQIDNPSFDISLITGLDDAKLDNILNSTIIHYNLTFQVTKLGAPGGSIIIPKDDTVIKAGYINKNEIKSILKAFKNLGIEDFDSIQVNNELLNKFVTIPEGETKTVLDIALESKILQATLSYQVGSVSSENLVIPTEAKETNEFIDINSVKHQNIKVNEFKSMINAVLDLGIQIDNPSFDISLITGLDDAKLDGILESKIIHFNLTSQVTKLGAPGGSIIIPSSDTVIKAGYINKNEIKSILKAFKNLGIEDFDSIKVNNQLLEKFVTIPEGETKTVLDIALESKILQATLSDQVGNVSSENLVIPTEAKETNEFMDINSVKHQNIKVTEFKSMINAVLDLGIQIDNPSFDISLITGLNDTKLDSILESKIIHFNLTSQVVKLGGETGSIIIPSSETVIDKFGYINKVEIKSIVKALKYLGFNDFDSIVINNALLEKFVTIPEGETKSILKIALSSKILHATLSDKVMTLNTDQLAIPEDAKMSDNFNDINNKVHQNILADEFENMINSVLTLGIQIDNPEFSLSLITKLTDEKVSDILLSKIIHFNMTKVIKDLGTAETIIIPATSIDEKQYIAKTEILSMIGLLRNLGIEDFNDINVDSTLITKLNTIPDGKTKTTIELALESSILHATLSEKIISTSGSNLVIPTEAKEKAEIIDINNNKHTNLIVSEFSNLVKVLDMLEIDVNNPSFAIEKLLKLDHKGIDLVLSSYTINYNLTDTIKKLGDDNTLIIPNSDTVIKGDYIANTEIYAIVDTLNALEITDFASINVSADILGKLVKNPGKENQDVTNIKNMFASKILKATISNKILAMDSTITIPDEVKEIFGGSPMIKDDEFINMIVAVAVSNTDLNKFELSTIYSLNSKLENDLVYDSMKNKVTKLSVMLDSKIIHGTISKSLLDVTAIDKPAEIINGNYIVKGEISALITALQTLVPDATDFSNIVVNKSALFNLVDGKENEGLKNVLGSKIIHYTISKKFYALGSSIIIPNIAKDGEYITVNELGNLIFALKTITSSEDASEDFSVDFNASNLLDFSSNIDTILKSSILHATVSDVIVKVTGSSSIILTESVRDTLITDVDCIKVSEIKALFDILNELGASDLSSFKVDENMIINSIFGNANMITLVKKSTIMRASLTPVALSIKKTITVNRPPLPSITTEIKLVDPEKDLVKEVKFGTTTEIDVLKVEFFDKPLPWVGK